MVVGFFFSCAVISRRKGRAVGEGRWRTFITVNWWMQ